MKAIHIGSLASKEQIVKPIEEDFRQLRSTAEKMVSELQPLSLLSSPPTFTALISSSFY